MKSFNRNTIIIGVGTLVIGFTLGWVFFGKSSNEFIQKGHVEHTKSETWTCSMHPQIRQPEPGQCPICGMDLVPLNNESASDDNPMVIKMSPTAMQLANVRTSIVQFKKPIKEVRMNGKIQPDERKVYSQTAHIPGRIEKLLINFTGEYVTRGQVLGYVYSPQLVTAQEELFEAYKIKESQPELFEAAKSKLLNWKLTNQQLATIIESGQPQEHFAILADVSGVVLTKHVNLGDYVNKGLSLFEIADLSTVWVLFDVYESDMQWVKVGVGVDFTFQSFPGESFKGKISFIDPVINPNTRVATARVEVMNQDKMLKPEMFALGVVSSSISGTPKAIVVPKSAVMWTGERSVVYVKISSKSGIGFLMREVVLGSNIGSSYIIKSGLEEGEEVATSGTFSIDAAAQLAGKPSMMNPEGCAVMTGHNHGGSSGSNSTASSQQTIFKVSTKTKEQLSTLIDDYLLLKDALVKDNFNDAKEVAISLSDKLDKVNMEVFGGKTHNVWMEQSSAIKATLKPMGTTKNIGELRKHFKPLSDQFVDLVTTFGPFKQQIYVQHCPMANQDKGADWISINPEIQNPYFGKAMMKCGSTSQVIVKSN